MTTYYISFAEIVLVLVSIVVIYFHQSYQYWSKKGVPTLKRKFLLGNTNTLLPKAFSIGILSKEFYDKFKKQGHRLGGIYLVTQPNLVLTDPELIKDVLIKDFQFFVDRGIYYNKKSDPLSAHLFSLDGFDWKNLRNKLTLTFSSSKMKMMFGTVLDCSHSMLEAIEENLDEDLCIKDYLGRFTMDVIGSCAFGIECNSFTNPNSEFPKMGKKNFEYDLKQSICSFVILYLPKLARKLGLGLTPEPVGHFFRTIVTQMVQFRKENKIRKNDFLQNLIDLNETSVLTIDEMVAQAFLFFIAGYETSCTTMMYTLYELSQNFEVQKQVRIEIEQILSKFDNKITYESLNEMKFLSQVIDESLRLYPPVPTLNRRCVQKYTFKNTHFTIDKGTPIIIPIFGLQRDPEFYPEPDKFKPGRDENRFYFPFGDGPRNCIGLRFGLMQTKIGIIQVIRNFQLSPSPKTKPVEFDPYLFLLQTVDPIYVRAEKL